MEFNEKLQKLRTGADLTQEELAEKLYVSRTAISKWESGRGYPSIDSLKAIAAFFHITIDELIGGEEIVTLAKEDIRKAGEKTTALLCGVLDCLPVLLLLLPVFGNGSGAAASVPLLSLNCAAWQKAVFFAAIVLAVLTGFCTVVAGNFEKPTLCRRLVITGFLFSVASTVVFIAARQPYAAVFSLCLLLVKGFLAKKHG